RSVAHPANVSIAVYRVDSLTRQSTDRMESYLWLTSDLKGTVESASSYFTMPADEANQAMDNLMLTQGWRRYNWNNILNDSVAVTYMPEFDGHIIKGNVINASTSKRAENI